MKAKTSSGDFEPIEPIEEASHIARLFMIVGMGTQYDNKYDKNKEILKFCFEFPYELRKFDGIEKPKALSKDVNNIISDNSGLTEYIKAVGEDTGPYKEGDKDLEELLGTISLVEVTHREKGDRVYENLTSFSKAKEADKKKCPELYKDNAMRIVDLTDEDVTEEDIRKVYPFLLKNALDHSEGLGNRELIQEVYDALIEEKKAAREAKEAGGEAKGSAEEKAETPKKAKKKKKEKKAKK